jgi:hypothetical protein
MQRNKKNVLRPSNPTPAAGVSRSCVLQPTAIAAAVSLVFAGAPQAFAQWRPNVEVFVKPGSERSLAGVDALIPFTQTGTALGFLDVKARTQDNDSYEFNLGLGYRRYTESQKWALGAYLAFDRRRSPHRNTFDQATLGLEARSEDWDFRVNFYEPLTDKQLVGLGTTQFQGFGLFRNGTFEEAMGGYDVEVGKALPLFNKVETRVYLAGYRFEGEEIAPATDGARVRFEVRPQQNVIVGLSYQHDSLFGSATFVEVRYAFGKEPKQGPRTLSERMTDPWQRDIDVVVSPVIESTNPAFSQQVAGVTVVHVDSTAAVGGDGSFERRYDSVAVCATDKCSNASFNTVRLWQGASTPASPYDSIALQPGQTLWGEGVDIFTNAVSGRYPVIGSAGLGGPAVTLANNSSVAGVQTQGQIVGNNVSGNITIRDSIIEAASNGININNAGAGITSTITLTNNRVTTTSGSGVYIRNYAYGGAMQQTIVLTGNTINATGGDGVFVTNRAYGAGSTATQTVTLTSNAITGTNNGVYARNYGSYYGTATQNLNLSGNTISGVNSGLYARNYSYYGVNATQNVTLTGNTINATGGDGVHVINRAYGAYYGAGNTAMQTVTLTSNAITGTNNGVYARNDGSNNGTTATQSLTLSGNTITGTYNNGVYARNYGSNYGIANQSLTLSGNTISGTTYGLYARNYGRYDGIANQVVTLSGDTITASGVYGVGLRLNNSAYYGTAIQTVDVQNSTVNAPLGTGISMVSMYNSGYYYSGTATQAVTLQNSTLNAPTQVTNTGNGTCTGGGVYACP